MEPNVTRLNPEGMHRNPAFSQAVVVEGNARTIYVGAQNAVAADGRIVGDDLATQTEQAFTNLKTVLAEAGARLGDVVKWTICVVQGEDIGPGFGVFQREWRQRPNPPAVGVLTLAGLANPAFLVEVDAIAVIGNREARDG